MKKMLSILSTLTLVSSTVTSVVACGDKKDVIYLILPENPNTQWQNFIDTATNYLKKDDTLNSKYKVRWASSEQRADKELENTRAAVDGGAKAIIIGQNNQNEREAAKYVNENNVPLIGVNIPFSADAADNEKPNFQVIQEYDKGSKTLGDEVVKVLKAGKPDKEKYGLYEMWGTPEMNGVPERHNGFKNAGNWDWIGTSDLPAGFNGEGMVGNWVDNMAYEKTKTQLGSGDALSKVDVVYAHNDGMARAARQAIEDVPGGREALTTTFNDKGEIEKLGILVVGYDYDSISQQMIADWGKNADKDSTYKNLFATMEMSATEMAEKAMAKAVQEIENQNANKGKMTVEPLTIALHMADHKFATKDEE
ncbi:ribose transport system substrate-binding protein [Spiroplasma chinense]|uniref:Ribose transport system substrate-binding protein n=1 Tax=Spiroplasma chinense TaxID=216932 RepID=A0A5B9Y3U9_9MOLU|nr:substrate-binding domain-containing protein [Spiroplasma chinense]QEH61475.1 ribose transport system substrate-binding protein [Spiroplasma chinense]